MFAFVLSVTVTTAGIGYYVTLAANTTIGNNITTSGSLTVGSSTLFSGAVNASSTLQVTGAATLYSTLTLSGTNGTTSIASGQGFTVGGGALAVVGSSGRVGLGTTTPQSQLHITNDDTGSSAVFALFGYNGSTAQSGLRFKDETSGLELAALKWVPASNRFDFYVGSSGNTNDIKLQVTSSGITASGTLSVLGTATSTFVNGIQLSGGCFRDASGSCVGSGGGTINAGTAGQFPYYSAATTLTATSSIAISTNTGNIGIGGTTTPSQRLTLKEGVFLHTSGGAPAVLSGVNFNQIVTAVQVSGKYAFIGISTDSGGGEFFIYDVSNPKNPAQISSVEIGAGVSGIYTSGKYAYLANGTIAGTCSGTTLTGCEFRIYDISNPASPTAVGGIDAAAGGQSIYISGKFAYVGFTSSNQIRIYDISSPSNPLEVGGISVGASIGNEDSIYVSGKYLYLVNSSVAGTCSGTTLTGCEFRIYDISNPASPAAVAGVDLATHGEAVYVSGKYAYVTNDNIAGTCSGTTLTGCDFRIYDISNPSSPTAVSGIDFGTRVTAVETVGKYSYVVTEPGLVNDFHIVDITTPSAPVEVGGVDVGTAAFASGVLSISGKYAYFGWSFSASIAEFQIFDISGSDIPAAHIGSAATDYLSVAGNARVENNLYVANGVNIGLGGLLSDGQLGITGTSTFIGRVGLATTSPSQLLSVHGNALFSGDLSLANLTATGTLTVTGTGTSTFSGGLSANLLSITSSAASSTFANGVNLTNGCFAINGTCVGGSGGGSGTVNSGTQGQISFYNSTGTSVSGTSTIFINTSRQVGINATNTADIIAPFVVVDDGINGTALFKDAHVGLSQGSILTDTVLFLQPDAADVNSLLIQDNLGADKFVITRSGNVGVGTTTPGSLLALHSGSDFINFGVTSTSTFSKGINLQAGCIAVNGTCISGGSGAFTSAGGYTTMNTPADSVGIGTSTPSQKLSVQGNALFSGDLNLANLVSTGTLKIGGNINPSLAPASTTVTRTTTTIDSTGDMGRNSDMVIGVDGLPVIVYRDNTDLDGEVVKCGNAACSSGNIITTFASTNNTGSTAKIAIGADGLPIIVFRNVTTSGQLEAYKCANINCTSGTTVTVSTSNASPETVAMGRDGLPLISWYDNTTDNLKVTKCGNASCSSGNTTNTIESLLGSFFSSQSSMILGADGLPVISYYFYGTSGGSKDLKVAKCGDDTCSSGNTLTTVDSTNDIGQNSSMALGSSGFPIIAYYDNTNGYVRVTKCGNASCSSGNTSTAAISSSVNFQYIDLAIGTDGLPVIAYGDSTNGSPAVFKCNNESCSSGTSTLYDSPITQFSDTSIAIGQDGLPVVSYWHNNNNTTQDLKVLRCATASCSTTAGSVFAGGTSLGGWKGTPGSYGSPFQSINTIQISNPTNFKNLSFTTGGFERLTITPRGNMGVGTTTSITSSTTKLFITDGNATGTPSISQTVITPLLWGASAAAAPAIGLENTSIGAKLIMTALSDDDGPHTILASANQPLSLEILTSVDPGPSLWLATSGNVGFGTTTPGERLTVAGNLSLSGNILPVFVPDDTAATSRPQASSTIAGIGFDAIPSGHAIAISTDGFPIIAYRDATNSHLKVTKCGDSDCHTATTTTTVIGGTVGVGDQSISIAVDRNGLPYITYSEAADLTLHLVKCANTSCSATTSDQFVDGVNGATPGPNVSTSTSVAITTDNNPVISYYDATNGELRFASCANAACSSFGTSTLDGAGVTDVGAFNSMTVLPDDSIIISYYDITNGDLKTTKCKGPTCGGGVTATSIDTTGDVGKYTSVSVATDGMPIISYYDVTNANLKIAKCTDTACVTAVTPLAADSTGDVGQYSSIVTGIDGLPIISYYDLTNTKLKTFKCSNSSCSSTNGAVTTDIDTDNVGKYSTIAINPDGMPVIAYYATADTNVRMFKCNGQNCAGLGTGYLVGGSDLGSLSKFFNNAYVESLWAKQISIKRFDLAEDYYSREYLSPGEIVSLDPAEPLHIRKASGDGSRVIGIVSTEPALVLSDFTAPSSNDKNYPIALAGRVPVKVNDQGGSIAIGDPISLSSEAGIGKRAVSGEAVIGYALDSFVGNSGTIRVFVNLNGGNDSAGLSESSGSLLAQVVGVVKSWLEELKVFVEDGLVRLKVLKAEKVITDGIEMRDKATGEFYCVVIENGEFIKTSGECTTPATDENTSSTTPIADTIPPTITLNGDSTISIEKGTGWVDPGATVLDPANGDTPENPNLSIYYQVDGQPTGNEGRDLPQTVIDTNQSGSHVITYSAADSAGNTGTAQRTLNITDPAPAPIPEPSPEPEPTPEPVTDPTPTP